MIRGGTFNVFVFDDTYQRWWIPAGGFNLPAKAALLFAGQCRRNQIRVRIRIHLREV